MILISNKSFEVMSLWIHIFSYFLNKHYLLIQNIKNKLLIVFKPNLWIIFFKETCLIEKKRK